LEEKHTFKKEERLKSRKIIGQLFRAQQSLGHYPFRLLWTNIPNTTSLENPVLFTQSVPKKKFKHAVDRNLIRRRIREAYRLNKSQFYANFPSEDNEQIAIMVIYIAPETLPYSNIAASLEKMLNRFHKIRKSQVKEI
jgi:ribonuclease P protein component